MGFANFSNGITDNENKRIESYHFDCAISPRICEAILFASDLLCCRLLFSLREIWPTHCVVVVEIFGRDIHEENFHEIVKPFVAKD